MIKQISREINQLAIEGGIPSRRRPDPPMYPGGNLIGVDEEQAVLDVVRSKRLFRYYGPTDGPSKVEELERVFAARVGIPNALAVSSGTAALMCGLAGLGIGPGDEVIVPAYTWIASASAVMMMGAIPIIAEVDESLTLDPGDVVAKITPRTRAIMPVHMRGGAAHMDDLVAIAREYDLRVIEDVAQANGGSFRGKPLGTWGDVGCFSLQFKKLVTCGEGGIIITTNDDVYQRALIYHDPIGSLRNNLDPCEALPGMNFRMPELSGAVALVQLMRLDLLLSSIRVRKHRLQEGIADVVHSVGGTFRVDHDADGDTGITLIVFLPTPASAHRVACALKAENITAKVPFQPDTVDFCVYAHWEPIMSQRTWTAFGGPWRWGQPPQYHKDMCPRSLDLLGRAVLLDVNPQLSLDEIDETIAGITKVLPRVA